MQQSHSHPETRSRVNGGHDPRSGAGDPGVDAAAGIGDGSTASDAPGGPGRRATRRPTTERLASLFRGLLTDIPELLRAEGRLARAETAEKIEQLQSAVVWVIAGLLALMIAAFVLVQAGIDWLAQAIGEPAATLVFGLAFLVIGAVLFFTGRRRMRMSSLRPHRTIAAAKRSARHLREAI